MIKALKRKFVLINMLVTGAVLTAVICVTCVASIRQFVQSYDRALSAEISRSPDQKRQFLPAGDRRDGEPDGEDGLNYLCEGYKHFFGHIDPKMRRMADLLRAGRDAPEIMEQS